MSAIVNPKTGFGAGTKQPSNHKYRLPIVFNISLFPPVKVWL
jgi:hypothetical protein